VHKSKASKSSWVNDIVLPASEKRQLNKDKTGGKSRSSDVTDHAAVEKADTVKPDKIKKLSDLEASSSLSFNVITVKHLR